MTTVTGRKGGSALVSVKGDGGGLVRVAVGAWVHRRFVGCT